jgi:hypothetical protein
MHTFVVDSSSTTRLAKKVFVVDSSNTTRAVKKIWVIDSGGTPRLVFQSASVLTMVAGSLGNDRGFFHGSFGSITPTTLLSGQTVQELIVTTSGTITLNINGFSSNPGSTFLTSLMVTGPFGTNFTLLGSAASFVFGGGASEWDWTTGAEPLVSGSTYTVTITTD